MTETKTKWRRAAIFVFTLLIAFCLLLPAGKFNAYAAAKHAHHGRSYSSTVKKHKTAKKHKTVTKNKSKKKKAPGTVTNVDLYGSEDGTVDVSWTEPSANVTSYELKYKIGSDDWQTADVDTRGEYTLQTGYDKNIQARVRAFNGSRAGRWSGIKSYYMKPEYGHYEIETHSITLNVGETRRVSYKYVKGWKGGDSGSEQTNNDKASVDEQSGDPGSRYIPGYLDITGLEPGTSTYTLCYKSPVGGDKGCSITIQVKDPGQDA